MENENKNTKPYDHEEGLRKQREYNHEHGTESDAEANEQSYAKEQPEQNSTENDFLGGISNTSDESKNVNDEGYKQTEDEEMNGERIRKHEEENLEKGIDESGAKDSHGVSINESGNITEKNDITENTKERATIDLTGRSVI